MTTETVRYRYRAYPDKRQQRMFSRLFGCVRVVYNDALDYCRAEHAAGRGFPKDVQRHVLTEAKARPERAWLNEVYGVCLIQSVNDAKAAYRNFFDSVTGKRKGRRVGLPRYKSRHDHWDSARFTRAARFKVETDPRDPRVGWLVLHGGLGRLRFAQSRHLPAEASSVTLIREPDGRYYVSFVVERPVAPQPAAGRVAGIDVGLSSFAHVLTVDTATGEETTGRVETPAYLRRRERALARSQRNLSRKQKGSANRGKARHRVAVHHRKVRQARLDHAHQTAARLVATHDLIGVEDLSVRGMARTNHAKSVHDQAMSQFLTILAEKARRAGVRLVKVDRWYPSTQTCSACGSLTGPKGRAGLSVRTWTCTIEDCGVTHDRDINAARNILTEALRGLGPNHAVADGRSETLNACGGKQKTRTSYDANAACPAKQEGSQETSDDPRGHR